MSKCFSPDSPLYDYFIDKYCEPYACKSGNIPSSSSSTTKSKKPIMTQNSQIALKVVGAFFIVVLLLVFYLFRCLDCTYKLI